MDDNILYESLIFYFPYSIERFITIFSKDINISHGSLPTKKTWTAPVGWLERHVYWSDRVGALPESAVAAVASRGEQKAWLIGYELRMHMGF